MLSIRIRLPLSVYETILFLSLVRCLELVLHVLCLCLRTDSNIFLLFDGNHHHSQTHDHRGFVEQTIWKSQLWA